MQQQLSRARLRAGATAGAPSALHRRSSAAAPSPPGPDGTSSLPRPLPRVVLKGGKSKLFSGQQQSPTVFSGAVDRVVGRPAPRTGDVVLVCDGAEKVLGWGVFNEASMFRVRIMQQWHEWQLQQQQAGDTVQPEAGALAALVRVRLDQAAALRRALGLPSAATTVYRMVNAEGDRLSGLVVDALGDHAVVVSSAAWVEQGRETVTRWLQGEAGLRHVVWRQAEDMLLEEGVAVHTAGGEEDGAAEEGEERGGAALDGSRSSSRSSGGGGGGSSSGSSSDGSFNSSGTASSSSGASEPPVVVVQENGVNYAASPLGQKTGFYADQRDSRLVVSG